MDGVEHDKGHGVALYFWHEDRRSIEWTMFRCKITPQYGTNLATCVGHGKLGQNWDRVINRIDLSETYPPSFGTRGALPSDEVLTPEWETTLSLPREGSEQLSFRDASFAERESTLQEYRNDLDSWAKGLQEKVGPEKNLLVSFAALEALNNSLSDWHTTAQTDLETSDFPTRIRKAVTKQLESRRLEKQNELDAQKTALGNEKEKRQTVYARVADKLHQEYVTGTTPDTKNSTVRVNEEKSEWPTFKRKAAKWAEGKKKQLEALPLVANLIEKELSPYPLMAQLPPKCKEVTLGLEPNGQYRLMRDKQALFTFQSVTSLTCYGKLVAVLGTGVTKTGSRLLVYDKTRLVFEEDFVNYKKLGLTPVHLGGGEREIHVWLKDATGKLQRDFVYSVTPSTWKTDQSLPAGEPKGRGFTIPGE